jgi:hypothetical protein
VDDAAKRLIYERNGVSAPRSNRTGFSGSFSDPEALRILAARNVHGQLGKTPTLSPEDEQLLAGMRTNRQGRAVLGAIAQTLRIAYEQRLPFYSQVGAAGKQLAAAMKSRLDGINNYAQRVYAGVPDDDAPLTSLNQQKIALTLAQARDAANDIDETVRSQHLHLSDVAQGIADILTSLVKAALEALGSAIIPGVGSLPPWVKIAVGGVVVVLVVGAVLKIVRAATLGGSALAEAEDAAVAIAEAKRRKLRVRRVLSIS